jgi:hypothetical protein
MMNSMDGPTYACCGWSLHVGHAPECRPTKGAYIDHYAGPRKQDLTTPATLFDGLHREYGFTLDGAASHENALLPRYSTIEAPLPWVGERVFCNPPWSNIRPFIELAATAALAVLLVPARCNAKWFHRALELGAKVRCFLGKPRFGNSKWNSPVDCVLLVFGE